MKIFFHTNTHTQNKHIHQWTKAAKASRKHTSNYNYKSFRALVRKAAVPTACCPLSSAGAESKSADLHRLCPAGLQGVPLSLHTLATVPCWDALLPPPPTVSAVISSSHQSVRSFALCALHNMVPVFVGSAVPSVNMVGPFLD